MWRKPRPAGRSVRPAVRAVRAFVAYRICGTAVEDRVVARLTGGRQVHCEMMYQLREAGSVDRLVAIGSIYPDGVYMSDVFRDPFYGICDSDGKHLPVQLLQGMGSGGWEWHDVTEMFGAPAQMQRAFEWNHGQVGMAAYNSRAILSYPFPCARSGTPHLPGAPAGSKGAYTCSELCADTLVAFSADRALRADVLVAQQRLGGCVHGDTGNVSPHALHAVVERDGRATAHGFVTMRLMASRSAEAVSASAAPVAHTMVR
jgi:hypothetical protein